MAVSRPARTEPGATVPDCLDSATSVSGLRNHASPAAAPGLPFGQSRGGHPGRLTPAGGVLRNKPAVLPGGPGRPRRGGIRESHNEGRRRVQRGGPAGRRVRQLAVERQQRASSSTTGTSASSKFLGCMVTDTGGIDDKSFNQSSWEGMQAAAAANPARSRSPTCRPPRRRTMRRTSARSSPRSAGSSSRSAS